MVNLSEDMNVLASSYVELKYSRVLLSVQGGSRYQYIPQASLSVRTGLMGLFISTKKWLRPGPPYQYSEWITRYVWINFVPIVNQTRGVSLFLQYR